ncbi:helix-turn-helix transcriptional regulator [Stappia sp. F7233]|uniref:Helix-turn-helix transcriptional regulator n=1 Tax=Stappia albiluteola TaxID=2758565 RepID=A0A839AEV0_9HYPH|nr:metalloregulator ArsR/SmtB family transcription factor [Stappia albiluteola]MBA5777327.1 helix-turn-helix transcriptional regulator [Stappia albiluteola]
MEDEESITAALKALSSPVRLQIMEWLRDPRAHFPPQRDGDLVEDGVCVNFITAKLGLSQPSASVHMKMLAGANLVRPKRIKQSVFYKRNEEAIRSLQEELAKRV